MPAEFLQQAFVEVGVGQQRVREFVLSPVITKIFNAVLKGCYPESWQTSALVPVPKPKGKPDVMDDHRGIAVSPVIAKLFSIAMLARLDKWAESRGLRAAGQAGFRAGRGTPDHLFVLRHLIDTAKVQKKPLFCAFIDFSKAYDRVNRNLLWRCLKGCGLHGAMLHTIQAMYESVQMRVRVGGKMGAPFSYDMGVKQGCPLSPLLFGILIGRLEPYLERHCPGSGHQIASSIVRALLYADDVVLVSESADGLRAMLKVLEKFCVANSMFVNTGKSEVVVFNRGRSAVPGGLEFPINGAPLPVSTSYVYLGLKFEDGQPCRAALQGAVAKAKRGMFALFSKCYKHRWHNVDLMCHLFDSVVKPVLCYGCEVWGVDWTSRLCIQGNFASGPAEEEVHKPFLRQVLGVCKSTPCAAMYMELNRQPIPMFWLRMAAKLWNKALSRKPDDILRQCLKENVRLVHDAGLRATDQKRLWSFHFTKCMDELGVAWRDADSNLLPVDLGTVGNRMADKWSHAECGVLEDLGEAWALEPCAVRAAPASFSHGFKLYTYMNWFALEEWSRKLHWSFFLQAPEHIKAMAQLRLGSHWLEVQQGRLARPRKPRKERCCVQCNNMIEDEAHLLECQAYADLREKYGISTSMTPTDAQVKEAFAPTTEQGWHKLAEFILQCKLRRTGLTWNSSVAPRIPPAS